MSNVALTIGGRTFTVACAAGEEDHVAALGRLIDAKLDAMGGLSGQSETRMLLFAALLLADELHEARAQSDRQSGAQPENDPAREASAPALPADSAARLETIAARLENLASRLESRGTSA